MKLLKGVVTPMVTPFLENGNIDINALEQLTEKLIASGVHGLFPCGTTGEGPLLSIEERKQIAEIVIKSANSRVVVYLQTGAMSLRDTIELSLHSYECGADGIGVVTPSYYDLTQNAIEDYYSTISEALPSDFPIYLYSIPQNTLNDITPQTAASLAEQYKNIVGIKYSGDNFVQLEAYTKIRKGSFSVFSGSDRTFAAVLAAGCDGTVSGLSNIFTELIVAVYQAYLDKDFDRAMTLQRKVFNDSQCLFEAYFLASLKAGMGLKGMPVGSTRQPLPDLVDQEYQLLKKNFSEISFKIPE